MTTLRTARGVVDPVTLTLVAAIALAAGVFGTSWKPFEFLKPKPPTVELSKAQADLAAANAAAEKARQDAAAANAAERAKLEAQIRAAQQDNAGTQAALERVPSAHKTPEVKLAESMALRVDLKLAAAIGKLPDAERNAMVELVALALSGKQAEIDEANRRLAERDAAFAELTIKREADQRAAQAAKEQAAAAEAHAASVQGKVTDLTDKVKASADKLDAKDREAGGFAASAQKAWNVIIGLVCAYGFLAYVLPGIIKHMDDSKIKRALRDVSGFTLNPLLYLDAKAKLLSAAGPAAPTNEPKE